MLGWVAFRMADRVARCRVRALPLTVAVYDDFAGTDVVGDALTGSPAAWDALRASSAGFALPASRDEFLRAARAPEFVDRGLRIAEIARSVEAHRVCSYGVGAGLLERGIYDADPDLDLVCTDAAPNSTRRLAEMFPEADVRVHDFTQDAPISCDLAIFHRVDPELDDATWRTVLARLEQPALLIVSDFLRLGRLLRRGNGSTRVGYLRTEQAFPRLWPDRDAERLEVAGLTGFLIPHA